MARIIRKGISLEQEYFGYQTQIKQKGILALGLLGGGILLGLIAMLAELGVLLVLAIVPSIIAIVLFASVAPLKSKMDILQSGIEGENITNSYIALLPETYTAFRNLRVAYAGKSSEIDTFIIGPTGAFVVETKHLNGTIYGTANDAYWTQYKVGRAGTPYTKTFYSPVKQVNTHVYRIANYLREHGIRTYVNSAVYFSNNTTAVQISGTDPRTPVFSASNNGANHLLHHILNHPQQVSPEECKQIITLLQNT